MKAYGGSGCLDRVFLTLDLVGSERSTSRPGRVTLGYTQQGAG
jgi:hypothetical protein